MSLSSNRRLICVSLFAALASACSASTDDETEETPATTTGKVGSSGGTAGTPEEQAVAAADDLSDLKLSSAFAFKLPAALAGESSSALSLTEAKLSQEACQLGETVREATRSLGEVGGFLCHLEVEKDKLKFGVKYEVLANGQKFARIFVDNSEAALGKVTIGMCSSRGENETSTQLITISGLSDAGPKGSIRSSGSYEWEGQAQSYKGATDFDMSGSGIAKIVSDELHKQASGDFVRRVELALAEAGVSVAKVAGKGNWQGQSHAERGVAKFDGTYGSAIFQSTGTHEGNEYSFARASHFNQSGEVVDKASIPATLLPTVAEVPAYLAADFVPASAEGWVGEGCPDIDDSIDLNPESAEHAACEGDRGDNRSDCWNQDTHQSGSENVEMD